MRILDRYILKSVVGIFLSCIFLFLFMYVTIDLLSRLEDIFKNKITYQLLLQFYLSNIPVMFVQITPFACLLSTLYAFGKLNHSNEIIAMRSSGLSVLQVTKTAVILGFILSLFIFWISDRVIPRALSYNKKVLAQMDLGTKRDKAKKDEIIRNLSMYGLRNRLFFINKFMAATNTMEGITILEHDEHQNITKKIVANKGIYADGMWKFYHCITYNFDENGQIVEEPIYFEEEIMAIPESPQDFINQRQRPDLMDIAGLQDYIWKLSRSGASSVIRSLKVDLYQRFTSPFTCLIIILLGIPFSFIMRRKSTGLSSVGISIIVGFLYYILEAISIALGKGGILPPLLAASASHLIALIFSFHMINTLP